MTVVSSKEFATNQEKYFDMAENEVIYIKRGKSVFHLIYQPIKTEYQEQVILTPDDNLRNAITVDELLRRVHQDIHNKFASRI